MKGGDISLISALIDAGVAVNSVHPPCDVEAGEPHSPFTCTCHIERPVAAAGLRSCVRSLTSPTEQLLHALRSRVESSVIRLLLERGAVAVITANDLHRGSDVDLLVEFGLGPVFINRRVCLTSSPRTVLAPPVVAALVARRVSRSFRPAATALAQFTARRSMWPWLYSALAPKSGRPQAW